MPRPADQPSALVEIIAQCVEALESGAEGAVSAILAAHPEHATAARARLDFLSQNGLIGSVPPPIDHLESFGCYEVGPRLGAGGMGSVWAAEQTTPVRRQVALKVIKTGMDSEEIVTRFAAERQALAFMNHPNIAQLYDAGVTPGGRPYFAMELVDGEPITQFADRRKLTTAQRLDLMMPVFEAVQHAHQKGIIHRDLKPSNVLVTERDSSAVVKVIDFGVAKAIHAGEGLQQTFTHDGKIVGTPEYMSPEQAGEAYCEDLDIRTDVYALGVLLYELLTSQLPIDSQRLRSAGLREMLRVIQEEDPPPASARITTLNAERATEIASARRTTPDALRRQLHGELDWITTRAIEKERDRRYATAKEFADDLRRFMIGEPVQAGPREAWYYVRKWVRRHVVATTAATITAAGLIGGLVVSLWFAAEADAARAVAATNFANARSAVDAMLVEIGTTSLEHVPQMERVRRDILQRAVRFYEGFVEQLADQPNPQPVIRLELAQARLALAQIQRQLGDHHSAIEQCRAAAAVLTPEERETRTPLEFVAVIGTAHANLAISLARIGRDEAAIGHFETAVEYLRQSARHDATASQSRSALAGALLELGKLERTYRPAGQRSEPHLREALSIYEAERRQTPNDSVLLRHVAMTRRHIAIARRDAGELASAIDLLETSENLLQSAEVDRELPTLRTSLAIVRGDLAALRDQSGQHDAADAAFQQQIACWRGLAADFPAVVLYRDNLARALSNRGTSYSKRNRPRDALAAFAEAVDIREALVQDFPDQPRLQSGLVHTLGNCLNIKLISRGRGKLGPAVERCADLAGQLHQRHPGNADYALQAAEAGARLAHFHTMARDHAAAAAAYDPALAAARRALEIHPRRVDLRQRFATFALGMATAQLLSSAETEAHATYASGLATLQAGLQATPAPPGLLTQRAINMTTWARVQVATSRFAAVGETLADLDALAATKKPGFLITAAELLSRAADATPESAAALIDSAIDALRRAVELGLPQPAKTLRNHPRLASLRQRPEDAAFAAELARREGR